MRTKCPHCDHEAALVEQALGKNIRCKGCGKAFLARPVARNGSDPEARAAGVRSGPPPAARPRSRPQHEEDAPAHRRGREPAPMTLWIGLAAIALMTTVASATTWVLIVNRHPAPVGPMAAREVKAGFEPPKAEPKVEPKQEGAKTEPPRVEPKVEPAKPAAAGIVKEVAFPASLYGDQGGEAVAPAQRAPFAIQRARAQDAFYRISNLRFEDVNGVPRMKLRVDFTMTRTGKNHPTNFVIRTGENQTLFVGVGDFVTRPNGVAGVDRDVGDGPFPEQFECFFVIRDEAYGVPTPVLLVSNVLKTGNFRIPAVARDWMPEEIELMSREPPENLRPNHLPNVGVDTEFVGTSSGLGPNRYVDPKGHLLGVECRLGSWAGENALGAVRPIFRRDQAKLYPLFSVAKEGYAVSGAELKLKTYVNAIKLHFRKIRPDGSLDPNDSYEGPWVGVMYDGTPTKSLGDTGARVIGLFTRSGAVVDGMALVLDR